MCSHQDSGDRVPLLQMNSELEHAQLELLSAHCATHQLRLHYSADFLARFARRDILHKSAEAASPLHEFYSGIKNKIAPVAPSDAGPFPEPSQPTNVPIAEAIHRVGAYLRQQREYYLPAALPLSNQHKARMWPYFSTSLLDQVRVVELQGQRVPPPPFYAEARALGFDQLPEITHMESLTFLDIVVFNETITERSLFHALVHAVQFQMLGAERYTELFVQSFMKSKTHFTVPLEAHAFSLVSKFLCPSPERFSVEDHVREWIVDRRY
jgi:hypothetical protein